MSFDDLGLTPELLRAVADQGYTEPTPVQAATIPLVLAGRDVRAAAQTGTGKTAAFVLPILQFLHATGTSAAAASARTAAGARPAVANAARPTTAARPAFAAATSRPSVRVLVLVPTRELALQVEESVRVYGAHRRVRSTTIYGGVGYDAQVRALRGGSDVVVATPGRLLDHVGQRTIDLSRVEVLVLDEADRMLDMGFIRDIRKILALLPARRQNLLFSATFSDPIRELADGMLDDPATVEVARRNTPAELVRQVVHPVEAHRKRELLSRLVRTGQIRQALVFTRTKHGASRLAEQLVRDGIAATAIHGNKSQPQRVRALDDFKAGRADVLVATDIASRGLDIDSLPHVVNFELPTVPEDYVHRIGRTGRAGTDGIALSLVSTEESKLLRDIEMLLGRMIDTEEVAGFTPLGSIRPLSLRTAGAPRPATTGLRSAAASRPAARPAQDRPAARPAQDRPAARPAQDRPATNRPTPARQAAPRAGAPRPTPAQPRPVPVGIGRPQPPRPADKRQSDLRRSDLRRSDLRGSRRQEPLQIAEARPPWARDAGRVNGERVALAGPRVLPGERIARHAAGE